MELPDSISFLGFKRLITSLALLLLFAFAYHKLIQNAVHSHPESVQRTVREHCRFLIGKQIKQLAPNDYMLKFQACDDFTIMSVETAGGLYDPVILRVTLNRNAAFPLEGDVFVFKSNAFSFNFLHSLSGLMSDHWEFNFYNTYSDMVFYGSI